jgi:hypothetical protein
MLPMHLSTHKKFFVFVALVVIGITIFVVTQKHAPVSSSAVATSTAAIVDQVAVARLQADLQGVTPYFVDSRSYDGKPLTTQEEKIQKDVIDILVSKEPDNREYYSQLWPRAIGKRYVLVAQPSASGYYDIVIDSQTGESSYLQNGASYITHYLPFERPAPATNGRQAVLYIGYQDVYTYTIDQPSFVLVPGSKLSGSETYHNGRGDFNLQPEETHTENTIHISIFDSSQVVKNPYAQANAIQTMNKKLREVTLSF